MIISKGKAQAYPELRGKLENMRYPAYIECKIDGELNWFDGIHFTNKSGKVRSRMPAIQELSGVPLRLLGELHWGEGKSGDLYEFLKHQDDDELRFTVFDVDISGETYIERRKWLLQNITDTNSVKVIPSTEVWNKDDVMRCYTAITALRFEGIVVKPADSKLIMGPCPWAKVKKRETSNLRIHSIDKSRERIEVFTPSRDGTLCGVKVPNNIKATLKVGDLVEIEHLGVLSKGGLRNPIFIRSRGKVGANV